MIGFFHQLQPAAHAGLHQALIKKSGNILLHKSSIEGLKYKKCIFPCQFMPNGDFPDHNIGQGVHEQGRTRATRNAVEVFPVGVQARTRIAEHDAHLIERISLRNRAFFQQQFRCQPSELAQVIHFVKLRIGRLQMLIYCVEPFADRSAGLLKADVPVY